MNSYHKPDVRRNQQNSLSWRCGLQRMLNSAQKVSLGSFPLAYQIFSSESRKFRGFCLFCWPVPGRSARVSDSRRGPQALVPLLERGRRSHSLQGRLVHTGSDLLQQRDGRKALKTLSSKRTSRFEFYLYVTDRTYKLNPA